MKKVIALALSVIMLLGLLAGCGTTQAPASAEAKASTETEAPAEAAAPETREFTDSVGRTVTIPYELDKIAVSGPLAQIVLFSLAPDKLVGIANEWDKTAQEYFDEKYYNLPVLGQLYGGKGELNLETLLASGAQIVIDVGEPKGTIVEDLDALTEQTGIPFVHITATTDTIADAYTLLGELLGMEDEAAVLADYCRGVYDKTIELAGKVEKVNALYLLGDIGLNVIANGSYHAEIIDLLTNNLAVVTEPSSKGSGNEVDMEQIILWNPDVIIFAPNSIYDTVADMPEWQSINAIKNGTYYEAPFGPYNWLGFPPSVQRLLGMMWLSQLLYGEEAQYDLYTEVSKYFELFYHCNLTQEQYNALIENSIGG